MLGTKAKISSLISTVQEMTAEYLADRAGVKALPNEDTLEGRIRLNWFYQCLIAELPVGDLWRSIDIITL